MITLSNTETYKVASLITLPYKYICVSWRSIITNVDIEWIYHEYQSQLVLPRRIKMFRNSFKPQQSARSLV